MAAVSVTSIRFGSTFIPASWSSNQVNTVQDGIFTFGETIFCFCESFFCRFQGRRLIWLWYSPWWDFRCRGKLKIRTWRDFFWVLGLFMALFSDCWVESTVFVLLDSVRVNSHQVNIFPMEKTWLFFFNPLSVLKLASFFCPGINRFYVDSILSLFLTSSGILASDFCGR